MDCVGIDRRLEKLTSYLSIGELNNVKILGICGMGGIGKTTLASVLYGKMYPEFEDGVFLSDVRIESRKHGLLSLQNRFLSAALRERRTDIYNVHRGIGEIRNRLCRKRVLVVLDDVDDVEQLECLVGDREWFGPGSRIVITTRDEHLVTQHGADQIYRVDLLNLDEAFQLFCLKAFKRNSQKDQDQDVMKLSYEVVNYASGLPLAINVLASSLYGRSVKEWESALERLKAIPNEKIMCKLQISFDGLEEIQKKIFLDIACFFVGKKKDYVIKVLGSCGFHPDIGLKELVEKALITISNGQVWMHDLLQELGQDIVNRESRKEAGQRSRIWLYEDFNHILMNDTGSEQIEGIVLDLVDRGEGCLSSAEGFMKMKYVRVLILRHVQFLHDLEYLSNELKYLEWHEYPFKSLPSTFQPNKLVELHMPCSRIEQLWKAVKPVKSLKIIDLSYSRNLIKTLDFTEAPSLEELNLQGCSKLCEVHHSIGVLKRLVSLNLKDCKTLVSLPSTTCNLKSLKILILSGCLKLTKLPERLGDMTSLEVFDAAGVGTEELPLVETGDCMHRYQLASVLPCLITLPFLRKLNLSGCNLPEGAIPNDLTSFPLLKNLDLSGNDFLSIPSSICQLSRLKYLSISKCKRLQYLPDLPSSIEHLSLERCISLKALPNLSQLSGVTYLYFENCKSLQSLPNLPLRIEHLDMRNCTSLQTLPNLVQLSALKYLEFLNCTKLKLLPDLSSSIERIDVENCTSLQTLPNLLEKQNLEKRFYIGFLNCSGLNGCEGKFSMALTWLKSYLLWIQEVRQLCERQKNYLQDELGRVLGVKLIKRQFQRPDFYFFLPGSRIPDWFNHKGRKYLDFPASSRQTWNNILGFFICVILDKRGGNKLRWRISGQSEGIPLPPPVGQWEGTVPIPGASVLISKHLSFFFVVNELLDASTVCKLRGIKFSLEGEGIKKCGIRLVVNEDVEELIQSQLLFDSINGDSAAYASVSRHSVKDRPSFSTHGSKRKRKDTSDSSKCSFGLFQDFNVKRDCL